MSSTISPIYAVAQLVERRYISNIEMPGGTIRYVPLHPPKDGATRTSPASEWKIDFEELEKTINSKTKMIVSSKTYLFSEGLLTNRIDRS